MVQNDELAHYGVLGMKWGVRKNPSKAYSRAVKKKQQLDSKAANYNLRSAKLRSKALKKYSRATNERQYQKARSIEFKANEYAIRSAKYQKRGMKWARSMDKTFAGYEIKRLSKSEIAAGQKYVYELTKRDKK